MMRKIKRKFARTFEDNQLNIKFANSIRYIESDSTFRLVNSSKNHRNKKKNFIQRLWIQF